MKTAKSEPGEALARGGRPARALQCRALGRVVIALLIVLLAGLPASAGVAATDQETIARILELRSELARLELGLSPDARAELERRLAEVEENPQVETGPSPSAAPLPNETSTRVEREPAPEAVVPAEEDSQVATDPSPPSPTRPEGPPAAPDRCNAFAFLDTDGDGSIDAGDRHWRHLFLWRDHDQDGQMSDREVENPFDLEISGLRVDLRYFNWKDGTLGDIRLGEYVVFEDVSSRGASRGYLVVEATRIKRYDGPQILDASGSVLEGFQLLRSGMAMMAEGQELLFRCP